jgi:hypothetical protein
LGDAEQAFSSGWLQVNHMQHNTSSQTFEAQMAVESWTKTPMYPGFDQTVKIVDSHMAGKDKEEESDNLQSANQSRTDDG